MFYLIGSWCYFNKSCLIFLFNINLLNFKTLIIIPCFNEETRLSTSEFLNYVSENKNDQIHFLFVNDGSLDNTSVILSKLKSNSDKINVLNLKNNSGKAEAIRKGIQSIEISQFDFIGYFDADLAAPLSEIENLIYTSKRIKHPEFILGSRIKLIGYSKINRKSSRHYIGRVFATVVSNMLDLAIYDTQCGAKLISSKVAKNLFNDPFISKWLFDVELLFRYKKICPDYSNRIIEVPLEKWEDVAGSKIKLSYFLKAPFDLLKIYFKYN